MKIKNPKVKVTEEILKLFSGTQLTTTDIINHSSLTRRFTRKQIFGGIGNLRSKRHICIITKLPYGHLFA